MSSTSHRTTIGRTLTMGLVAPLLLASACKGPPTAAITVQSATAAVGGIVALSGDQSTDPNGETLSYAWRLDVVPAGSRATMVAADEVHAWFTPDISGQYTVELKVADADVASPPVTTMITAGPCGSNAPSIASVTSSPAAPGIGTPVSLSAMASDADNQSACGLNQQLTYHWSFVSLPAGVTAQLNGAELASPGFIPQVAGTYVVGLVVTDSTGLSSAMSTQQITVSATPACGLNLPVAKVGAATAANCNIQNIMGCTVSATLTTPATPPPNYLVTATASKTGWNSIDLQLDASASFDPDNMAPCNLNDALSYKWDVLAAPLGASWSWQQQGGGGGGGGGGNNVIETTLINPTLTLRNPGTYQVRLTVSDGNQVGAPVLVQIVAM